MSSPGLSLAGAGFIQFDVKLGEIEQNLAAVKQALAALAPAPGAIIALPELWAAGFDYPRMAEHGNRTPEILKVLQEQARLYNICLAGSLPEIASDRDRLIIFNTLYFTGPEGVVGTIRKQQLFAPMAEDRYFTGGTDPQPVQLGSDLLAGVVCFDLRFPDLIRHQAARGARLLVVSSQWPAARREHWRILLRARAIENQIFVIGCNRCGTTDGLEFGGHSMIVAPDGTVLAEAADQPENILLPVDQGLLGKTRELFTAVAVNPYSFADQNKVMDLAGLKGVIAQYQQLGRRVVFTNGCFDILHRGHVTYLEEARRLGDCLVIGLNSDASVRSLKGPERPMNDEQSRARVLAALGCVDHVVLFGDDTPLGLITELLPDLLVKGGDWPVDKIVGAEEVMAAGGGVLSIPLVGDFSTTALIERIQQSKK
ncbi:MAG: D-glycero-beta-D-manno-heptose 1-phosphate adenylyltransferase [Desulfobulbaceae bacterium]|nr:D-glycero-beta-D-manno-heptose 1-phosphate adenylyltransferase [Desulfobulbaceae bacterium]